MYKFTMSYTECTIVYKFTMSYTECTIVYKFTMSYTEVHNSIQVHNELY